MIFELILQVIYTTFTSIMGSFIGDIPRSLPTEIVTAVDTLFSYIQGGAGVLANYIDLPLALEFFFLIFMFDTLYFIYRVIMWVLNKIPFVDID